MVKRARPSRAEAGDIANIILDGADCIMLTHETSMGKYPINATKMLAKVCCEAEKTLHYKRIYEDVKNKSQTPFKFSETIASNIASTALNLKIGLLIVFTENGRAAKILAKYRPRQVIFVCTTNQSVIKQMNVVRGVISYEMSKGDKIEDTISKVIKYAKDHAFCTEGTKAIVQTSSEGSGLKDDPAEECNMMKVYDINEE
eukprot:CAMPEP_0205809586 /NCGR_PEP_ID=MMETSP0205-20121125/13849_1 /ASSEMBLY_ACC=CAM_ASM_000278 /TAXON_ID=36767 /ORGANISM="Euplotes focardii, Strain TN1" /LENGTH=200 /DNA_ID=CAMNT_0053087031 /DNA_START=250 /DNA_END=849 /DNA_ORIENTATION=-